MLLTLLLLTAAACGGSDGGGVEPGTSIASMLKLIPATAGTDLVIVTLVDDAIAATGSTPEGEPGDRDHEVDRVMSLSGRHGGPVWMPAAQIIAAPFRLDRIDDLVLRPSSIRAEIIAGQPPAEIHIAVGDDIDDAILTDTEALDGTERRTLADHDIVTWLDDNEMEPGSDIPFGPQPGWAGRLALPRDGVLVHTTADEPMEEALAGIDGDEPTLADDDDLLAVATALDDADVYAGLLSTNPPGTNLDGDDRSPSSDDGLTDYLVLGTGGAIDDDGAVLVIVLQHADADSADRNAETLGTRITDGTDLETGRPWSDLLGEPEIDVDDRTVTARIPAEVASLWFDLVLRASSLLAIG